MMTEEGKRLRRMVLALRSVGLTVEDIARESGVAYGTISYLSCSKLRGDPNRETVEAIERLFRERGPGTVRPRVTARFAPGCAPRYGR